MYLRDGCSLSHKVLDGEGLQIWSETGSKVSRIARKTASARLEFSQVSTVFDGWCCILGGLRGDVSGAWRDRVRSVSLKERAVSTCTSCSGWGWRELRL